MKTKQRRLSHQEKSELFKMYETGKYIGVDLAKIFNISSVATNALLRRHGYKAKTQSELQRKYSINETFFDIIDTQEKAYVLGLLYADGYNNTDRNSVSLGLKETDREVLDKITALIQPSKPLQYVNVSETKGFENSQNQYRLVIANKHISQRLVELGCVKAKTHNLTFPTEEQVPSHLIRHFIRGYFDGDGSVSNNNRLQMDIVGTISFLEKIQEIIESELDVKKSKLNKRHKKSKNEIRALQIRGKYQCLKFKEFMYDNATIYLKRKYNIFNR